MKTAKQVKDLIRNLSKKTGVDPQILIRQYMMDHLLERISQTQYRDHFILKGGMLISALVGVTLRSTLDMDATIQGFPLETSSLQKMFDEILAIEIDDAYSGAAESRFRRALSHLSGSRSAIVPKPYASNIICS